LLLVEEKAMRYHILLARHCEVAIGALFKSKNEPTRVPTYNCRSDCGRGRGGRGGRGGPGTRKPNEWTVFRLLGEALFAFPGRRRRAKNEYRNQIAALGGTTRDGGAGNEY